MALRVLVINAGSATLKWSVIELPAGAAVAQGNEAWPAGAPLELGGLVARAGPVEAVAHRVVHGGAAFRATARVDEAVLRGIESLAEVDPLHAPRALAGIRAAQAALPGVPEYACFDTAFHATLPEAAWRYPLPYAWAEQHGVRRYGFHGLSVAHAVRTAPELAGRPLSRLVVAHLGSGCSITAVADGRSVDTTMGFTPLEGVMMGTRSGSVDPGALLYLLRERGLSAEALDQALSRESGLLGVSGQSADLRELQAAAEAGAPRARLTLELFVHSVRRNVGAVLGALGGLDALVFTGGIGEHSALVRREVVQAFAWAGLALDEAKNAACHGDADLSPPGAARRVLVVTAREDLVMAREAERLLRG